MALAHQLSTVIKMLLFPFSPPSLTLRTMLPGSVPHYQKVDALALHIKFVFKAERMKKRYDYGYLTFICAFHKNRNTSLRVCCGLFMRLPPPHPTLPLCLNTWPPTSGSVWKDMEPLGSGVSLEEVSHWLEGAWSCIARPSSCSLSAAYLLTWYDDRPHIPATMISLPRWIISPLWAQINPYPVRCFLCTLLHQ